MAATIDELIALVEQNRDAVVGDLFPVREAVPRLIEASVYHPVICLILQGSKETTSHAGSVRLGRGDMLVVSHDTPVTARITGVPYLALILPIDLERVRTLEQSLTSADAGQAASVLQATAAGSAILETLARLLAIRPKTPEDSVLTPLLLTELHFHLLRSPAGAMLRRLVSPSSHESRIARVAALIRRDYARVHRLADLAREAGMGQSAFHHHFKAVTGTTPLQFQKDIRLSEALRLLEQGAVSVTEAGLSVGYESPAQFSRDFSRRFGRPPRQVLQGIAAE